MACSNCNTQNCGCSGTYVVSQTCPPACSEVFNSACIVYTGVDIICNDTTVSPAVPTTIVHRNDYLDTALTAIVNYVCSRFNTQIHPTTVVDSGDAFILVSSDVVGAQTTYTITLDPSTLPTASIVTSGENVTVTGDGSAGDPYVVNSQESIVAVEPGTALSVIASSTGLYENTYTIDIDYDQLPDVSLITSQGYISITEQPGVPNAGDTQYTLDVDQVTVTAADVRLTSTETAAGGAPNFLRTFDVAIDETEMSSWIMNSVVWNTDPLTDTGLIAGAGIAFAFDPVLSQIEISSAFVDPDRWDELSDFAGNTIQPSLPTSTLAFLANPATVDAGGDGISAVLQGIPSAAEVQFTNTDPGSGQLIFGSVEVLGQPTIIPDSNTEVLTFIEGANIGLVTNNGVGAKSITIVNEIDFVFSSVAGDTGVVSALNTVDQVQFVGGESITTTAAGGGPATVTIDFDGLTVGAGLTGTGTSTDPLVNDSPANAITLSSAGGTSLISGASANPALEILGLTAGTGIGLSATATEITITAQVTRQLAGISYTAGDPLPATVANATGEAFVQVRCFNGNLDVTSTSVINMQSPTGINIQVSNPGQDIDNVLIIG
jgi:hypothetical protein